MRSSQIRVGTKADDKYPQRHGGDRPRRGGAGAAEDSWSHGQLEGEGGTLGLDLWLPGPGPSVYVHC